MTEIEFVRARHAVTEMKRVLDCVEALSVGDFVKVGQLINASHISLRDDYTVSCPELDTAVDASLAAGALGSRMVGGGFGGSDKDTLFHFKSGFSDIRSQFKNWNFVVDQDIYNQLNKKVNVLEKDSNFFPLYRFKKNHFQSNSSENWLE